MHAEAADFQSAVYSYSLHTYLYDVLVFILHILGILKLQPNSSIFVANFFYMSLRGKSVTVTWSCNADFSVAEAFKVVFELGQNLQHHAAMKTKVYSCGIPIIDLFGNHLHERTGLINF